MLVQLPILWAFFPLFCREIPADGATVFLGLWVLSEADPYYVFPVLCRN
jgi:membrane protein insertase Oxa1/YidC/SpoIIIJ